MLFSNIEDQFLKECFALKLRPDGRKLFDYRNIQLTFLQARGALELKIGGTTILSKTTLNILPPRPDRPSEGFIVIRADTSIKGEDSRKLSIEISTLLERVIKESNVLDPESLCITTGKYVWSVSVELILEQDDGNVIDAMMLALTLSLMDARKPGVKVEKEQVVVNSKQQGLSIHFVPISFTFGLFESAVFLDPTKKEQQSYNGRVTITMNIYKDILSIHKPGGEPIDSSILKQLLEVCELSVKSRVEWVRDVLAKRQGL